MKKHLVLITSIFLSLIFVLSSCNTQPEFISKEEASQESSKEQVSEDIEAKKEDTKEEDNKATDKTEATTEEDSKATDETEATPEEDKAEAESDFVGKIEKIEAEDPKDTKFKAADFSLVDQNGERHNFADYKGKVIILNFWQSWCGPCRAEMPDFQKFYEEYGENQEDVILLGVASPKNEKQLVYRQENMSDKDLKDFLEKNSLTYPSLMDYSGALYQTYEIMAFPSTFFIDKEGYIYGKAPGMLSAEQLSKYVDELLAE